MNQPFLLILTTIFFINFNSKHVSLTKKNNKIETAISTIEELSTYSKTSFGIENTYKTKIDFNPKTGKITYKKFINEYNKVYNYEISFYLNDIIKTSMEHKIHKPEYSNDLYVIWIDFKSKGKTIEWKITEYEKGKKYAAFTEKEFKDYMVLNCNNNELPFSYHKKYLDSWKTILGIESSTEKKD